MWGATYPWCNLPLGSVGGGDSLRGCDLPLLVGDHGHYEAVVAVEAAHQIHVCVGQREVEHLPRKQLQATNIYHAICAFNEQELMSSRPYGNC